MTKKRTAYISRVNIWKIRNWSVHSKNMGHREACGVFWSDAVGRIRVIRTLNLSSRPGKFLVSRGKYEFVKRKGIVWGVWHSHPLSPAVLGAGDLDSIEDGSTWLIYDVIGEEIRGWTRVKGGIYMVNLRIY